MAASRKVQDHLDQAQHHERFLDYLQAHVLPQHSEFAGWAMVVIFYSAFHYTKAAILRDHGEEVFTHKSHHGSLGELREGHNDLVRRHLGGDIAVAYLELFDRGHEARYRPFHRSQLNPAAQVILQRELLRRVKEACGF